MTSEFARQGSAGIEDLGSLLNAHYESLISVVTKHGGDVIAIIGDAILVLFASGPTEIGISSKKESDSDILAEDCARAITASLDSLRSNESGLDLHIGISCGLMHALHVGGQEKTQFLLVGDPLAHLQSTVSSAPSGSVCISPAVCSLLSHRKKFDSSPWIVSKTSSGSGDCLVKLAPGVSKLIVSPPFVRTLAAKENTPSYCDDLDRLLSSYMCKSVVSRLSSVSQGVDWLAEWRRLTVLFIKLHGCEGEWTQEKVDRLQECFSCVQNAAESHEGSVLHAFNDDKGLVVIIVFGLPLEAHENDPSRAVACAMTLVDCFHSKGNRAHIGISTGAVFCGCLGGSHRRDYTVLGSWVNMAARLMSMVSDDFHIPILCDQSTKLASHSLFSFSPQISLTLKGFDGPVNAFTPLAPNFRMSSIGLIRRDSARSDQGVGGILVGRENEMKILETEIEKFRQGHSSVVWVSGDPGMGKSTFTKAALQMLAHCTHMPTSSSPVPMEGTPQKEIRVSFTSSSSGDRAGSLSTDHSPAMFHVKSDPFVLSDFQSWGALMTLVVDRLASTVGGGKRMEGLANFGASPHVKGQLRHSPKEMEAFLFAFFMGNPSLSHLSPFLSLLNPYLRTSFHETPQCAELPTKSRPECLFDLCLAILNSALAISPICICVQDVHEWDPLSWTFASRLIMVFSNQQPPQPITSSDHTLLPQNLRRTSVQVNMTGHRHFFSSRRRSSLSSDTSFMSNYGAITGHPLFLLLNTRKQKQDFRDIEGFQKFQQLGVEHGMTNIDLSPLGLSSTKELIVRLLAENVSEVSQSVVSLVLTRSQGNPLFIRELVLSLDEHHVLSVDSNGLCAFASSKNSESKISLNIPQSIQDLIRSRVDSLSADQQMMIKIASVIGLDFDLPTLMELHPSLCSLTDAEECWTEIQEAGLCDVGDGCMSFCHKLTQEVSYSLLTHSQKQDLHKKMASHIERKISDCNSSQSVELSQISMNETSLFSDPQTGGDGGASISSSLAGGSSISGSGSALSTFFSVASLARHWVNGKCPEKARPYLASLAIMAHDNYKNREAVSWFTLLFEQELECKEKTDRLIVAKWYRYLGECYFGLGDQHMADVWLQRSLEMTQFKIPTGKSSTFCGLTNQAMTQFWRQRTGHKPKPLSDESLAFEHIQCLQTLAVVKFLLNDGLMGLYCSLMGANLCETSPLFSGIASVFYAFLGALFGAAISHKWANKYFDIAWASATKKLDQVQVSQAFIAFLASSCDPRASSAIENGITLMIEQRCWKELAAVHCIAGDHSYFHGLFSEYAEHIHLALEHSTAAEDTQMALYAHLQHACCALMTDDRSTAAFHLRIIVSAFSDPNVSVDNIQKCSLPVVLAHLISRDHMNPTSSSPHFPSDLLDSFLSAHGIQTSSPTSNDQIFQLLELGLKSLPDHSFGVGFFQPFQFMFKLIFLRKAPCSSKLTTRAMKILKKVSRCLIVFQPLSLLWSAFHHFRKGKISVAFGLLKESLSVAQKHKLPMQCSFAHFGIAYMLSDLAARQTSQGCCAGASWSSSKIAKASGFAEPLDKVILEHKNQSMEVAEKSGHMFYSFLFGQLIA